MPKYPYSEPKVIHFPALHPGTHAADVGRPHMEDKERVNNLAIVRVTFACANARWLVYLTWTTPSLSEAICALTSKEIGSTHTGPEGQPRRYPPTRGHQRCRYCISLNDVNCGDLAVQSLPSARQRLSRRKGAFAPRRVDGQTLTTVLADQIGEE